MITPEVVKELDKVDNASKEARNAYSKKKRPNINFVEMGVPI